ncbi:MAG: S8 family serine peptidase [Candidatus Zipacnadales bacterium]
MADDILVTSATSGRSVRAAAERVVVRFREQTDMVSALVKAEGVRSINPLPDGRLAIVHLVPGQSVERALDTLRKLPNILVAEPDYVMRVCVSPNDPLWTRQCGLRLLEFDDAWTHQRGDPQVTIAILDSGVAYDHPDLNANLRRNAADPPNGVDDDGNGFVDDFRGWDFADGDNDPHADRGDGFGSSHGTHVAGIAAAVTNNKVGMAGASWGCTYLPVRVVNAFGIGYLSDVARGLEYAVNQGVAVINLSLEGPFSRAIQAAIDYAYTHGVVVCAAAGNAAMEITTDPATWVTPVCNDGDFPDRSNHVIGVAAIRCDNVKLNVSNYGSTYSFIDLAAPGSRVVSTSWPGATYEQLSGTSQAVPYVAGAVALLISHLGPQRPEMVVNLLRSTAINIDADNPSFRGQLGAGRPNANALLFADPVGPIEGVSVFVTATAGGEIPAPERAQPGQGIYVQVELQNLGMSAARNVRCHLATGDPAVIIKRDLGWYGTLLPGEKKFSASGYRLRIPRSVAPGTRVPLRLRILSSNGGPWRSSQLYLPIGRDAEGEPDDTCAEAFPAAIETLYDRALEGMWDQDWFTFRATAGQVLRFNTLPRGSSSPHTVISIHDTDCGRELTRSDKVPQPARVDWVCPREGEYAVMVRGADNLWSGPYCFCIEDGGKAGPGPLEVTHVAVDDDSLGSSSGNGDGRADPGETAELRLELTNRGPLPLSGLSGTLKSNRAGLRVLSAMATFPDLGPNATGWSQAPFVVQIGVNMPRPSAPALSLDVTTEEGTWVAPFRLDVGHSDVGEPDDTCPDGALIQADGFLHHRVFEGPADRDWFRFDAAVGGTYRLRTFGVGDPGVDTLLRLHGPDCGAPLAFDDDGAGEGFSQIVWTCADSGRYSIVAQPAEGSVPGGYELSVKSLRNFGPGEPDNWCEQAAVVPTNGTPQPRTFAVPGDEDWITFSAREGEVYIIETLPAPGQVPRQVKSPPDGSPRAPDTVIALYEPACGQRLIEDDDGGEGLFSRLVFTPLQEGDYKVRITEYDDTVGAYQVLVRRNFAPYLDFVGSRGYESDVVEPQIGTPWSTRFAFKVLYRDPNGDEPAYVRLELFRTDQEKNLGPLDLRRRTGDPRTGILYVLTRKLPAGEYRCKVYASDGLVEAGGPASCRTEGPLVQETSAGFITSLAIISQPPKLAEIRLTLSSPTSVTARILNVAGREISRLASNHSLDAGVHPLFWNGSTSWGTRAPRGLYLVEVSAHSTDGQRHQRLAPLRW